ncbi:hypothetical protein [Microbaculum marinum]|uniref:DUF4402 domain-containing protein n=1 Tax=Microbaculum marinum TaxID=1764581 RepID=A0AAW9RMY1_9HYPH
MIASHVSRLAVRSTAAALGFGLALTLVAAAPAAALDNGTQVLTGGFNQGPNVDTIFTSPGMTTALPPDYPSTGQGETAVQVRMPAGDLSNLRVHVVTQTIPVSGNLRVNLRINGANTVLTCKVTGTGDCATKKSKVVSIGKGDLLAIRIRSTLVDEGNFTLTYSFEFD